MTKFGIDTANMFGFWDWVGGRYSMDSAIGLSTMLAVGPAHFRAMLDGFHAMDEHFRTAPFEQNLPVLMGLLAVWYNNFFGAQTVAVLPYDQYLKRFPAYLQQLTMESNGKHVTLDGAPRRLPDRPDLLGRAGHQRPALVLPADPSGHEAHSVRLHRASARRSTRSPPHHDLLIANVFAQAEALAFGKTAEEVRAEGTPDWLVPHRDVRGQPAEHRDPRRAPHAGDARHAGRAVRAQRVHAGRRSGASTRSTSGASSWARCWRSASFPSCRRTGEPELSHHDGSTQALIRRYRSHAAHGARSASQLRIRCSTAAQSTFAKNASMYFGRSAGG